jgi:hypothetical protein
VLTESCGCMSRSAPRSIRLWRRVTTARWRKT